MDKPAKSTRGKKSMSKYLYIACAIPFFLQAFGYIDTIPVGFFVRIFGMGDSTVSMIFVMFFSLFFIAIVSTIVEILNSLSLKQYTRIVDMERIYTQGSKTFIALWVAGACFAILASLGIVPSVPNADEFVCFCIGWYIIIVRPFSGVLKMV